MQFENADDERVRVRPQLVAGALIVVLLALLVVGVSFLFWKNYNDTREDVRFRATSASQVVSANVTWALETARQVLRRVDDSLGLDISTPPADAEGKLAEAISTLPGSVKVYVVDAAGRTLLTTDEDFAPIDIRDREYFSAIAAGEQWHITSLLVSRLNGEQIFAFSKRIERNGQFAGVAILSFSSDLMRSIWASLRLDSLSTVGLIRADGQLVSRFPLPEGPLDLSQYVLFTDYLPKASEGTYDATSPADGVSRMVAYRRIPGTALIALSSLSTENAFAAFKRTTISLIAVTVPLLLALALVAYWTFRMLRRDALKRENEAQFKLVAEAMPNHVWTARANGDLDWFNTRVYEFSGLPEGSLDGQGWAQMVHPDDAATAGPKWQDAVQSQTLYETEFRLRRHDGAYRWHIARAVPLHDRKGKFLRWIGTNTDIDDQKRSESALARSERRFRLSQAAAGIASLELDIASGTVLGSDRFWEIWGLPPRDSIHISELEKIVIPEDAQVRSSEETRTSGSAVPNVQYRIRRPDNGELRWLSRHIEFIHSPDGRPIQMFGVMQDITEQKEAQTRQEILTHELEHRIKNILAMVQALANQTFKDVDIETGRDVFNERLRALGTAHDLLTKTRWTEASMIPVIEATLEPLPRERINLDGPDLVLSPNMALSMALAVNELGTNALKYGALSVPEGKVDIVWALEKDGNDDVLVWRWIESGGPPVSPPTRRGFGSFLVSRVLATDFGGTVNIEYPPEGVRAELRARYSVAAAH